MLHKGGWLPGQRKRGENKREKQEVKFIFCLWKKRPRVTNKGEGCTFLIEKKEEEPKGAEDRKKRKSKRGFGLIETVCFSLVCVLYLWLSRDDYCRWFGYFSSMKCLSFDVESCFFYFLSPLRYVIHGVNVTLWCLI